MSRRLRILVTGAAGRIGRALCERLAAEHEVVGLDRVAAPSTAWVGDVGDPVLLRCVLRGVDAVMHVAALHAPHVGQVPDIEFERVNVNATRSLAEAAAREGVRHFVFTSTTALFGAGMDAAPGRVPMAEWIDETTDPRPRTVYHRTKREAELELAGVAARHGLSLTVLRISRCFPEPAPWMAVYRLHRGIDARDVADAHSAALNTSLSAGTRCFVISGATPFRRVDAAELAVDAPTVLQRRAPGLAAAFAQRGWALPRTIDRVYDSAAAQDALGWSPRHGFESVLRQAEAGDPAVLRSGAPSLTPDRVAEPCA